MKTRSAQSLPRARELTEVFHEGSDICLKCVIKELKNDKPHYDTESPLGSAFDLYFTLSGTKLDDWTAAVSERAGNQVLFIELLELLNVAFRWNAIVTTLDYDYGDEFTLTSLAIREKLGRIHKIIKGDTLLIPSTARCYSEILVRKRQVQRTSEIKKTRNSLEPVLPKANVMLS